MINGIDFARQESKKLVEEFMKSLQPTQMFLLRVTESLSFVIGRRSRGILRKTRLGSWNRELNRHLEALRIQDRFRQEPLSVVGIRNELNKTDSGFMFHFIKYIQFQVHFIEYNKIYKLVHEN